MWKPSERKLCYKDLKGMCFKRIIRALGQAGIMYAQRGYRSPTIDITMIYFFEFKVNLRITIQKKTKNQSYFADITRLKPQPPSPPFPKPPQQNHFK